MKRIFYSLIFIVALPLFLKAQCVPDASFSGQSLGLYPAALSDDQIAQGIVTAQACKGEPLNTVFTLVFDNLVFGSTIDSLRMDNVTGLPNGITFDAPFFTISEPGLACFVLIGTPSSSVPAGDYEITFKASAWLNGGATPSSVDFPGTLVQGRYIIRVQEASACCALTLDTPATQAASCSTTNNGEIGVQANNAIGGVTYQWDAATGNQTTQVATGLAPGTYSVIVTDAGGCVATASGTVGLRIGAVNFTVNVNSGAGCAGGGQATVNVMNGRAPFTYLWDNGETTQTATNLSEGERSVTVTDATGCSNNQTVVIQGGGNSLSLNVNTESPSCVGDMDGSAAITITGGNQGATFQWSTGQTTAQVIGLAAGDYTVTIDKDGCNITETVTVPAPTPVSVSTTFEGDGCTGGLPSSVTAIGSGGTGNYTYRWSDSTTGATFTPTAAGNFTVTATDGNGCEATTSVSLSGTTRDPITATIQGVDVSCNASADGSATVSASGGDGNLQYIWSNNRTSASISNLAPGTYEVTISDNSGCSTVESIAIEKEPTFTLSANVNDVNCNGTNDGSIALTPSRGSVSDFTFSWSNSANTASLNNLSAGNYNVTVTEPSTGCIVTQQYTIQESNPLMVSNISATDALCEGQATGTASITINGGTGQLDYQWSNGPRTASIDRLRAGSYTVTVTDALGCSVERAIVINEPEEIIPNAEATNEVIGGDGSATANPTGGTTPYTYIWSRPNDPGFSRVSQTINDLFAGEYSVRILDANGCSVIQTVIVGASNCSSLSVSFDAQMPSCNGADGTLTANPSGGDAPYTYLWSTGDNGRTIDNLIAGEYEVTITDQNGCPSEADFTLSDPADFSIRFTNRNAISCFNTNDGAITASATGGGEFSYIWSDSTETARIRNLSPGIYTVTATNSEGCEAVESIEVIAPDTLVARLVDKTNVSCVGEMDGNAAIEAIGGTMPYEFAWSNGLTTDTISNLIAGEYLVTVTDDNDCSVATSITITEPDSLLGNIQTTDTSCPNIGNGMATASISGGTGAYTYAWSTGGSEETEINIDAGDHTLTVTDENNCTLNIPFTITEPDSIFLSLSATGETAPNANDGTATVVVTGGVPPYEYEWDNGDTNATATNLSPGMRAVTVIDDNGCAATGNIRVNEVGCTVSISATGTDNECNGGNSGSATVDVDGNASSNLTFNWSNDATTQTINNLSAGTYNVTVVEDNGCEATTSVTISEPSEIIIGIALQEDVACDGTLGTIAATASGGTGDLTFNWSNGESTLMIEELVADTYVLTVTDENNCEANRVVTIEAPQNLEVQTTETDLLCAGENTGSANLQVTGANGNLTYTWSGGVSTTNVAQNLAAGTYQVTISEDGGCETILSVEIEAPSALQIALNTTNETFANANNGTAVAMVVGGTGNYQYDFGDGQTDASSASNLAPGDYTLTVTDDNGCTQTEDFTIEAATVVCTPFDVEIAAQDVSCANGNDGTAQVQKADSDGPFTYMWSTNDTAQVINDLAPGEYFVTIMNGLGCPSTQAFTIEAPEPIVANVTTQNVDCEEANNGVASIAVVGGTAPYTFNWLGDNDGGNERNNLTNGNYTVTITDDNNCTIIENFSIAVIPDVVPPSAIVNDLTVYLDEFGTATITADMVDNGSADECGAITSSISQERFNCEDVGENQIMFRVMDSNGNADSTMVTITVSDTIAPFINCLSQDILITDCQADRRITFSTPEAFDNCGDALMPTLESGLPSGSVFPPGITEQVFVVEDASGNQSRCSFEVEFRILELELETDAPSCNSFADGSISATVTNSSGTIFYNWSNDVQTRINTGLTAGTYMLTVVDGQGCTQIEEVVLEEPEPLTIDITSFMNPADGEMDGSINATVTGGTPPYDYQWVKVENNSTDFIGDTEDLDRLIPGLYRLSIVDDNGCFATSDLVSLEINNTGNIFLDYEVAIRPNPTNGLLFFEIEQNTTKHYDVDLFDLNGRWLQKLTLKGTSNSQTYDLSNYENGIYLMRIQVEDQILMKRVVVLQE